MKRPHTIFFIILLTLTTSSLDIIGQPPPPPESNGLSGNQTIETGGGVPIGGGLFVLLGLGAAYGSKKIYDLHKESLEK